MNSRRKTIIKLLATSTVLSLPWMNAHALPSGGTVSAGALTITTQGKTVAVTQTSSSGVVNWNSFNLTQGETVEFEQPNAHAVTLNRVTGAGASTIDGTVTANGQVWIMNQNGVVFGKNAQVNVSGLLATTGQISDSDFMSGKYNVTPGSNPNATVSNAGRITVNDAGLAAMVAPNVSNTGTIDAKLGHVEMASGDSYTVDLYGDGLINLATSPAVASQLVSNSGTISADGGTVKITAAAASGVVDSLINLGGVVEAKSVDGRTGSITVYAEGSNAVADNATAYKGEQAGDSVVLVSGTLDASGYVKGEKGGEIQVLGDNVGILSGAKIDASGDTGGGVIQIGGDFHGAGATPTALHTIVQSNTDILANAVTSGDGGKVTVWADDWTNYAGHIEAKGGALSGSGGYVETSGKQTLSMDGSVNASAAHGNAGTWLMDPNNATISTSATSNPTYAASWTAGSGGGNVNVTDIQNSLNGGTSVTITASGTITLNASSPIAESTYNGTETLTLAAGQDITLNSSITASGNTHLNVTLDADTALGGGAITLNSAANITTNGGNIIMGGGASPSTTAAVGDVTNVNGITLNGSALNAAGGNITLIGTGYGSGSGRAMGVYLSSAGTSTIQTTGSGNITITGTGGNTSAQYDYGFQTVNTPNVISTVNGNITITGTGAGSNTYETGLVLQGGSIYTTGTGNITFTGHGGASGNDLYMTGAIGGASDSGNITYNANSLSNFTATTQTTGTVTFATNTASTTIGFAGGTGTLQVTQAIMDNINAPTVVVGASTATGALTTGAFTWESTLNNLYLEGGSDTISGAITKGSGTNNAALYVDARTDITQGAYAISSSSTFGQLAVTFDADTALAGGAIVLNSSSSVLSNGGNIVMGGGASPSTTAAIGDSSNNVGLNVNGATLSAAGGNITLTGTGYAGTTNNYGIEVQQGSTIQTTGSGTITLTGTGGAGSSTGNHGVYITGAGGSSTDTISAVNGAITITGTAAGSAATNYGIYDYGATYNPLITTTGSGTITLTGASSGTATYGIDATNATTQGDFIEAGGAVTLKSTNEIVLSKANINYTTGNTPGVTLDTNYTAGTPTSGAIVLTTSNITTNGGNIILGGGTSPSTLAAIGNTSDTAGINLNASTLNAGGGNITLTGTGYAGTTNDYGILLQNAAGLATIGSGTITLTGKGGAGTAGDYGVYLNGLNTEVISAVNGAITLNGTAAGTGANFGIYIVGGASDPLIKTTGTGTITLNGAGAGTTTYGINVNDTVVGDVIEAGGNVALNSTQDISLAYGNISFTTGNSPNVTLDTNYAVATPTNGAIVLNNSNITTNGGNITLGGGTSPGTTGTVGNATNTNGISLAYATLNAGGGNISFIGTGYASTTSDYGVQLQNSSASTTGSGSITLTGTGGGTTTANAGIYLGGSGSISSVNGNILLTGTGSSGASTNNNIGVEAVGPAIESTGTGSITIIGKGGGTTYANGANDGVYISTGSLIESTSATGGAIYIVGYAGGTGAGSSEVGTRITGSGTQVTSAGGNIVIDGNNVAGTTVAALAATAASGANNYGVEIDSSGGTTVSVLSTGAGNITLNGTGCGTGTSAYGVYLLNAGATAPLLKTTSTGAITLNGAPSGTTTLGVDASNATAADAIVSGGGAVTINSAQDISFTKANINFTGSGTPNVTLDTNYLFATPTNGAISLTSSNITTNGGNIIMGGGTSPTTTGAVGNTTNVSGISIVTSTLNAGGGNITMTGIGGPSSAGSDAGIYSTSTLSTSGSGSIALTGYGGGASTTSANDIGIWLVSGTISSVNGNIRINGNYGLSGQSLTNASGNGNNGVTVSGTVQTTGTGSIAITGIGGGSGASASDEGIYVSGTVKSTATNNGGSITLIGYGGDNGGSGASNSGIYLNTGTVSSVTGNIIMDGNYGISGQGVTTASGASNYGIYLYNGATVSTTGTGTINMTGIGGGSGAGNNDSGIDLYLNAIVQSTATGGGGITLTGYGGDMNGSGENEDGVVSSSGTTTISSVDGNIVIDGNYGINGQAVTNATGGIAYNGEYGVNVNSVQATGTGSITITGIGGGSGASTSNEGLNLVTIQTASGNITLIGYGGDMGGTGSNNVGIGFSSISSTSGNILMDGNTGLSGQAVTTTTGTNNCGINYDGSTVSTTGAGSITLNGVGGGTGTGTNNYGVSISSGNNALDSTTTVNGNISISGTAASATGGTNIGVYVGVSNNTDLIKTTGTGNISLTGIGGTGGANNYGIDIFGGGASYTTTIEALGSGTVTLQGTGSTGTTGNYGIDIAGYANFISTTGAISLTGTSTSTTGIYMAGANTIAPTATAPITLNGMSPTGVVGLSIGGSTITSDGGAVLLESSTQIFVGTSNITYAPGTSYNLVMDANTAGAGGPIYLNAGTSLATNGGNITLGGGSLSGGLPTGAAVGTAASSSPDGISLASGDTINAGGGNIAMTGTGGSYASGTNYGIYNNGATIQTSGTGTITLNGTAGSTSNFDYGIYQTAGSIISGTGAINLNGTGGGATSHNNYGINITGGTIAPTGAAPITLTGTAGYGTAYGIDLNPASATNLITSSGGTVTLTSPTGIILNNTGIANAAGDSYTLAMKADAGGVAGDIVLGTGTSIGTGGGNASFNGVNLTFNGTVAAGAGTITGVAGMGGNINFNSGGALTSTSTGNAITLAASSGNFVDNVGTSALTANNGQWLVYSTNPANNTLSGLTSGFVRYSCTYGGSCPTFPATGNGLLYSYTPILTVTPTTENITYGDAKPGLSGYGYAVSGYLNSDGSNDTLSGTLTGTTSYAQYNNVGSYNINYSSGTLASALGYGFSYANNATGLVVGAKTLTASLTGTVDKTYDATTSATLAIGNYTLSGVVNSDTVTLNDPTSGAYDTKNVGTGKTVSVSGLAISGSGAGNYILASTSINGAVGEVDAKTITASLTGTVDKTYDGANTATLASGNYSLAGVISGDTVTLNNPASGIYDTKNVGTGKTVSVTGLALGGADGGNYVLLSTGIAGAVGEIDAKTLTASLTGTVDKTYDGTTAATLSVGNYSLAGVVSGDAVALNDPASGTYDTKNVGMGKTVSVSGLSLVGAGSGNYVLASTGASAAVGEIDAKTISATLTGTVDKTYDGTTSATLASGNYGLSGVVSGDTVTLNNPTSGTYDTKNVGTGKTISVTGLSISGTDSGNYVLLSSGTSGAVGEIDAKALTASLTGTVDKTYDGTTSATLASGNYALSGVIGGDIVTLSDPTSGSYDTKNVGTGKTVSVSGLTLGGGSAGNYTLVSTSINGAVGEIDAKTVTASLTGTVDKTYDGTTSATLASGNYALSGVVGGDTVTLSDPASGSYDTKNVGTAKTVSVTGLTLGGTDGGNYVLASTGINGAVGDIDAKTITATLTGTVDKTYNGNTTATLTSGNYSLSGVVSGDTVTLSEPASGSYDTKNVGTGKTVSVTGLSIAGADSGNYVLASTGISGGVGEIDAKTITAYLTGTVEKIYNGTTAATLASGNYALSGVIGGDTVTLSDPAFGSYDTKNVGTGKTVSVTGLTLGGTDGGNYILASTGISGAVGAIDAKTITASLTGTVDKTYNGNTAATLASGNYTLSGVIGGDTVMLSDPASGTYDTKNVGTGKTVSVNGLTLSGANAGNYTLSTTSISGAVGEIDAKALLATLTGTTDKTYDGNVNAVLTSGNYNLSGIVSGDTVTLNDPTSGSYATKDAGTGKIVSVSGLSLGGSGASNYTLVSFGISGAIGEIDAKTISASLTGTAEKTYDGTTTATLNASNYNLTGIIGSDSVSISNGSFGVYNNANVGSGRNVSVSGLGLAGTDAEDYRLASGSLSAVIGKIDPKTLTVSLTGVVDKTYDGTTSAKLAAGNYALSGLVSGNPVTLNNPVSGTYDTANAGTGKTVYVSGLALLGNSLGDYLLASSSVSGAVGEIDKATVNVTANSLAIGAFTAIPALTYTYFGLVSGDTPAVFSGSLYTPASIISLPGSYDISEGSLTASNYNINYTPGTLTVTATGSIAPAIVTPIVQQAVITQPTNNSSTPGNTALPSQPPVSVTTAGTQTSPNYEVTYTNMGIGFSSLTGITGMEQRIWWGGVMKEVQQSADK